MASNSKSTNLGGANVYVQRCVLTAWFNENSTSTANNTSNITCRASLYTPSAGWNNGSGRNDNLRIYWHDNRENYDRLVATWSGSAVDVGQTITAEGTINVTHKDDGTLSGYAYATWSRDGGNTGYAPASGGVATDWTGLTTIPRASQPTIGQANTNVPDFNIGDTITIYMNRKSSSFTHTVTFNYGSTSVQVATGVTNSCTFDTSTIANELYALIPNDNVYSNTISVKTYNGSTLIGTKTCAYNAHVVNSNPIIPTGSPANEYYYLNARDTLTRTVFSNNQFIQNISQVDCIVNKTNAMPTAQNGASLVKVICAFAGLTGEILAEDIPTSENSFSITLGTPTTYGTQTALLTAIDSRGNSTTVVVDAYTGQLVDTELNYIAQYSAPSIVASCERQSNFENDTTISISGAMTSLKRYNESTECNAVNATNGIQYRYKESTSSTWGAWKNVHSTTSADGSVSTTAFVISLDNQKEWDFEFKITDKISSTTIARHVGQGQPQFFIGADGRTSIGGVPQIAIPENKLGQLEVNGNAYANGNRLAEIPITNDMLGNKCVKSNNIDWTTLCPGANKVVATTFCFNRNTQDAQDASFQLKSNAGTTITFAITNAGTAFRIVGGATHIVRVDQSWGYRLTTYVTGWYGVNGVANAAYWTRATGCENGAYYTNVEQMLAPEAASSYSGYFGPLKTFNSAGERIGSQANFTCVRSSGIQSTGVQWSNLWSIMGSVNADGNLTYSKFSCQCSSLQDTVPTVYQKGLNTSFLGQMCNLMTIYEIVDVAQ